MKSLTKSVLFSLGVALLMGCGEAPEESPQSGTSLSPYQAAQLTPWKELCIDGNLPRVEEKYLDCQSLTPTLHCDESKALDLESLQNAWKLVQAKANADLLHCKGDPRVDSSFCYGSYEHDLSFYVTLDCQGAI